jgi:CheY-like chemotaxis protein
MNAAYVAPQPSVKPKTSNPPQKKILLTDDDPALRQIMQHLLRDEGYFVQTAANGAEAIEMAAATKFDLVLLDLTMPVMDGWETFEQMSYKNPGLPIILITARPDQAFSAMAAGVGALLEKPLDFAQLISTIHSLLEEPAEARVSQLLGRSSWFRYIPSVPGNGCSPSSNEN